MEESREQIHGMPGDPRRVDLPMEQKIPVIVGSVFGEFDFKPVLRIGMN